MGRIPDEQTHFSGALGWGSGTTSLPGAWGADGPKGPKGDIGLLDLHGQHELAAISGTFWKALT